MDEESQVFIVILNWNGYKNTSECLDSLKKLDYSNYKIVIVDNGSTDDSVNKIKAVYPDITLIENKKNLGFGGGCNVGIRFALEHRADYIWLLNNDTIVDKNALSEMVKVAENNPEVGAVGSILYYVDEPMKIQAWGGGYVNMWAGVPRQFNKPVSDDKLQYITGASLLLRSSALLQVGLFDERFFMYWEDTDLGFKLRKAGWKLAVANSKIWHKESASLGKKSPILDYYFNFSAVLFFRLHSFLSIIPILTGMSGRLIKRMLRLDFKALNTVIKGLIKGMSVNVKS